MRRISISWLILAGFLCLSCIRKNEDTTQFHCPCSQIGLDSLWADTTQVSCYEFPPPLSVFFTDKDLGNGVLVGEEHQRGRTKLLKSTLL
jgi:hypothetical protein